MWLLTVLEGFELDSALDYQVTLIRLLYSTVSLQKDRECTVLESSHLVHKEGTFPVGDNIRDKCIVLHRMT